MSVLFFAYGFGKNERGNISTKELNRFKQIARQFLSMSDETIKEALTQQRLIEVENDEI